MRIITPLPLVACLLTLGQVQSAGAADIDLFLNNNQAVTSAVPNVLIIVDNAASNNANILNSCSSLQKKLAMEQCVMANLVNSSAVSTNVNLGLELFTPSGSTKGGYINYAVRSMTAANKTTLATQINAIPSANNAPYALSIHEAYLYFAGKAPYAGISTTAYDPLAYSVGTGKYISPASDSCQRNYIIFIGNGGPDSSENNTTQALLAALGGVYSSDPITLNPSNYQSTWMDEYTRYLFKTDFSSLAGTQNITTYTVAVYDPSANSDNTTPAVAARALLKSAAAQGGGKYFAATDSASLTNALQDILVEIQSVNSVFAAASLPVSVNVRGTYLNQVYMGVFRPDINALPRWLGNLKEYQLLPNSNNQLYLADASTNLVTNSTTGFVNSNAKSYWTSSSTFWSFNPTGVGLASDSPDGDLVEKGAEAQWLRNNFATSQTTRKLYTCTGSCAAGSLLSATPFSSSNANITTANTGTSDATDLANLVSWQRGQDLYDENTNGVSTDARASIHGDVLHSRPSLVNYNRFGDNNDIMVFYGANDGIFHAIQGGQIPAGGTPTSRIGGTEQWGFIPQEFFGRLKRLRDNNLNILSPNPTRPYFADGPIGTYTLDSDNNGKLISTDGDKVQLFIAMYRGGRFLYALDVSDPTAPKFMWQKSNASSGYTELAQTWSTPKPVKIRAFTNPVLIMGAGYDAAADDLLPQGTGTMGRGVMIIDSTNGTLLWQAGPNPIGATTNKTIAGMTRSIAADMMLIDRDNDGLVDRIYAADTGGNIWRLDIDDATPSNWAVTKLASLAGSGNDARKFLFAPDVVYGDSSSGTQPYDAIMIGSGDREQPFDTTIINRFYMIKDTSMGKSVAAGFTTITETNLYDATANLVQVGSTAQQTSAAAAIASAQGWYITLASGEKVVGGSVTVGGTVFFGTNQPVPPAPGVCTNLGTARLYGVNFLNGSSTSENDGLSGLTTADRSATIPGGGFPPSPVPVVTVINGQPYQAVISGTQVQQVPTQKLGVRYRTFWHNNLDR